jgi:hypothetical protein
MLQQNKDAAIRVYLGCIDEKLDRVIADLGDIKLRVTSLEENQAGLQRRMDRFDVRLDRIERRLNLVEVPAG